MTLNEIRRLCQIVNEHPSIEDLMLDSCKDTNVDGYEMLRMVMTAGRDKIKALNLCSNGISTDGDTFLSDFLRGDSALISLDITDNDFDDNDAIMIANALGHNTKLRVLDFWGNDVSKSGWIALRKAEFDDTSLNTAADSNHTCRISYPNPEDHDDDLQGLDTTEMNGNLNRMAPLFNPAYVRQKKIYSILSTRNRTCSNVEHFEDIPIELLPYMLCSVQRYVNYHIPDYTMPRPT